MNNIESDIKRLEQEFLDLKEKSLFDDALESGYRLLNRVKKSII